MLVETLLLFEVIKLLEQEAEVTTEETALYFGDIDIFGLESCFHATIKENLHDPYENLYTKIL